MGDESEMNDYLFMWHHIAQLGQGLDETAANSTRLLPSRAGSNDMTLRWVVGGAAFLFSPHALGDLMLTCVAPHFYPLAPRRIFRADGTVSPPTSLSHPTDKPAERILRPLSLFRG